MIRIFIFLLIEMIFIGCGENSNGISANLSGNFKAIDTVSEKNEIEKVEDSRKIKLNISNNEKEFYILFTNTTNKYQKVTINNIESKNKNKLLEKKTKHNKLNDITNFNHKLINAKHTVDYNLSTQNDNDIIIGTKKRFYLELDKSKSTLATVRKIVKNVETQYGLKRLNIWVSNNSYGNNCKKIRCVKDYMLDELANSFLKDGFDNDIYDWVTNIFGEEWGDNKDNTFISNSNTIDILLTDIDNDNMTFNGLAGYFYAKDNYRKKIYNGSNEKVMFYIDSVMFAYSSKPNWSIKNRETKFMLSTLAHEFVHMIGFYQKNVKQHNNGLKPWIDEMLAVSTEDILATKLKTNGLREVSYTRGDAGEDYNQYGKFPIFNRNINKTLPIWNNSKKDYAMVSSFGSYLVRNYGGPKILHDILYSKYTDKRAIEEAINNSFAGEGDKDFYTIMQDWGIAVLLSSNTEIDIDSGYIYNLGDFFDMEYNNINYTLGSINFFNYYDRPNIFIDKISTLEPKSNLYYKVSKDMLSNSKNISIEKDIGVKVAIIRK